MNLSARAFLQLLQLHHPHMPSPLPPLAFHHHPHRSILYPCHSSTSSSSPSPLPHTHTSIQEESHEAGVSTADGATGLVTFCWLTPLMHGVHVAKSCNWLYVCVCVCVCVCVVCVCICMFYTVFGINYILYVIKPEG